MAAIAGPETRVNTYTVGYQSPTQATKLADGTWVVTWYSSEQDGSGWGVYQQHYASDGTPLGTETRVNTSTTDDQSPTHTTALTGGGWVVTWNSYGSDLISDGIFQQVYASNGTPVGGEVRIDADVASHIVALEGGGWVVAWLEWQGTSQYSIYQQAFAANGAALGTETFVGITTGAGSPFFHTTALPSGGWVMSWHATVGQDTSDFGVYQQVYGANGSAVGSPTLVNTNTLEGQYLTHTTSLADGGWVVTWQSDEQDGDGWGVYQQAYSVAGAPLTGETQVNTYAVGDQYPILTTALSDGGWVVTFLSWQPGDSNRGIYQQAFFADGTVHGLETRVSSTAATNDRYPTHTVALVDGGWVTVWYSNGQDGSGYGVYQRAYAADGSALGSETRVNTYTTGDQLPTKVTALSDGGWVATWQSRGQVDGSGGGLFSNTDIYQQVYAADGTPIGSEIRVNAYTDGDQATLQVLPLQDGAWVVIWESEGQDGPDSGVYQRVFHVANEAPSGTATATLPRGTQTFTLAELLEGFSDPDNDTLSVENLTSTGGSVTDNGDGTYSVTFDTDDDFDLSYDVIDGNGGSVAATLTVTGMNDAPEGLDATINLDEDDPYTFGVADFSLFDINGDSLSIVIKSLPGDGTLTLNGSAVGVEQAISEADLANLVFTPSAGFFGSTSFTFVVIDDGGTDNGGEDTANAFNTITLEVAAVNDAPTDITYGALNAAAEGAATGAVIGTLTGVDPENDTLTWSLFDNAGGRFAIDASTGVLTVANGLLLDFEQATSHSIVVLIDDGEFTYNETIIVGVGNVGAENLSGDGSANTFYGGGGDDKFLGFGGVDTLHGGGGNDELDGGIGDDLLHGGAGADKLIGGGGTDRMWGEADADIFVFNPGTSQPNHLTIEDFVLGVDKVDVTAFPWVADVIQQIRDRVDQANHIDAVFTFSNGATLTLKGVDWEDITVDDIIQAPQPANAPPVIFFGAGFSADREGPENLAASLVVTRVSATDANNDPITFSLDAGLDAALFTINSTTGDVRFRASADFETPKDVGGNNVYNAIVRASDGQGGSDTVQIIVTINNVGGMIWTGHLTGADVKSGTNEEDRFDGRGGNDTINGLGGNDIITGGTGADTMNGGLGNDTFNVDNAGDRAIELANQGTDRVNSSVTFTLGNHVENLTLTGAGAINGTGNTLGNLLTGNAARNILTGAAGNDTIDGKGGADTMKGGIGIDTYVVDNAADVADETGGNGIDLVRSSVTFNLAALAQAKGAIENLTLTGAGALKGTGNAFANTIIGNAGGNILTGAAGRDLLTGGNGRDVFDYNAVTESGLAAATRDIILDFVKGQDRIDLSTIDAIAGGANNVFALLALGTSTSAVAAGRIGWYREDNANNALDKTILRINSDADAAIEMTIEIKGLVNLAATDFVL